jgi:hypothetical protein
VIAQIGRKAAKCDGIVSFAAGAGYPNASDCATRALFVVAGE